MALPSGYKRLRFIQTSGAQYIDVGFKPNQNTRVVMDFEFTGTNTTNAIFGGRNNNTVASFAIWAIDGQIRTDYGSEQSNISISPSGRLTIDKNKNVTTVGTKTVTQTASTFQSTANLVLFSVNRATDGVDTRMTVGKLYSCRIYDNGTLIRDFTPVETNTGEIGLFDEYNSIFYGNDGTGSFEAGLYYEVIDPPSNLSVTVSGGVATLSWSGSPGATSYRIYQNGVRVGSTSGTSFEDEVSPSVYYTYEVTAYDGSNESDPASITFVYVKPNPPENLTASIDSGTVALRWDRTDSSILGYNVYRNGELVGKVPRISPEFEFPFSNESLTENLLILSDSHSISFSDKISPFVEYTYAVTAYSNEGESDPISISVYYETRLEITAVSLEPNPVTTGSPLTVSVTVNEVINSNIS